MNQIIKRSGAAAAVALAAGTALLTTGGQAAGPSSSSETLRVYERARHIQLTQADGTVRSTLPISEPKTGDTVDALFDVYRGNHRKHGKAPIGTDHLRCEFIAAGPPDCISHATIGSSMLVVSGNRITLGTGRFLGARGRVISAKEVKGVPPSNIRHNDIDVVVRVDKAKVRVNP